MTVTMSYEQRDSGGGAVVAAVAAGGNHEGGFGRGRGRRMFIFCH